MAVRIRENGRIYCAALSEKQHGDIYIDDTLHYELSVKQKILVTTPNDFHIENGGEWWWKNQVPNEVVVDKFYNNAGN